MSCAQVVGVQHAPLSQTSFFTVHVPQLTEGPQPLFTEPQVAPAQLGGVHVVHA
jgi:hypothetical protein